MAAAPRRRHPLPSMGTLILWAVFGVFAVLVLFKIIRVVPANHADVVERLGKYSGTLPAGTHVLMPFLDRVAKRYALGDQVLVVESPAISRDNHTAAISGTVRYQIVDPERAHYSVADIEQTIRQIFIRNMQDQAGRRSRAQMREEQREFRAAICTAANTAAPEFGIKILDCDLTVR